MSMLQWEESLMADAAGASGGPRTLREAIRKPIRQRPTHFWNQWCYVCGNPVISGRCTSRHCARSHRRDR